MADKRTLERLAQKIDKLNGLDKNKHSVSISLLFEQPEHPFNKMSVEEIQAYIEYQKSQGETVIYLNGDEYPRQDNTLNDIEETPL